MNPETEVENTPVETETAAETPKSPVTIIANNPSAEEMKAICEHIQVNYDFDVEAKETRFNFKKSKDKESGIETIRESVELAIPFPSMQGIIAILEKGGKGLDLLRDAVEGIVTAQARELLYDDLEANAATFPVEKLSWDFIANMPKAQRGGSGIAKEVWEDFGADYITVMMEKGGKNLDQATKAAKLLTTKLSNAKTNIPVLKFLVEQLAVYAENTENLQDYKDCVEFLLEKADTLINVSAKDLLAAL